MLLTSGGQRAGTISGGCLEAEVAKKAWWLTEKGPTIQRYSSFFDDDSPAPYGLGCGGTVHVLLERGEAAHAVLNALEVNLNDRIPFVIVTDTNKMATILVQQSLGEKLFSSSPETAELENLAQRAADQKYSFYTAVQINSDLAAELFVEYVAPSPALTIFGAGDDAKPLADFAHKLGWHITIADGRSHLARSERFPQADRLTVIDYDQVTPLQNLAIESAVLLTHSYEQDRALLRELLPRSLKYLGILGPRQRTERLIGEVSRQLGMTDEECMARLHAPVGFDIGAHTPESIALSIVTEIFAVLHGRDGLSLKKSTQAPEHINTKLTHV
jgi:xanthine/CO dehydrogenase XdhC/CoxF family maturation factor